MQLPFRPHGSLVVVILCALLAVLLPLDTGPAMEAAGAQQSGNLTFAPNPATAGQQVVASGCGFPATPGPATVAVGAASPITATSVITSATAGCYAVTFLVPAPTAGATSVIVAVSMGGVTDSGTLIYGSPVTVPTPGPLTFSPSPATSGQPVAAVGCGFSAAGVATVTIDGSSPATATSAVALSGAPDCYVVTFIMPVVTGTSAVVAVTIGSVTDSGTLPIVIGTTSSALTFSPNPASVGQMVTASGCGFPTASGSATILVGGTSPVNATTVTAQITPGCYDVAFVLPAVASGTTSVAVTVTIGSATDNGLLTLGSTTGLADLTLSPNPAAVGQTVAASGCGFPAPAGTATVTIDSITSATVTGVTPSGTTGCYSVSFVMPAVSGDNTTVVVTLAIGGVSGSGSLSVDTAAGVASLIASPTSVAVGDSVTLTGGGFTAGTQVTISAFGTSQTVAAPTGSFTALVTVPAGTAPGPYTIDAGDLSALSASADVTVTGSAGVLQSDLRSAQPGQSIAVTGSGFMPDEQVELSLAAPSSVPATAIDGTFQDYQADSAGTLGAVEYIVPDVAPGDYLLLAIGLTSQTSLTVAFTVLAGTPTPAPTDTLPPSPTDTPLPSDTPLPPTPTATPTVSLPPVSTAPTTTYFADGYTGTAAVDGKVTFTERLFFYNPGPVTSAVTTTYAVYNPVTRAGTIVRKQNTVAAGATISRLVNLDVGNDRIVSAAVSASGGIVAQEVINRTLGNGATLDGDTSLGTAHLATSWYLAEGYGGPSMQEYLVLYNPGTVAVNAQVRYLPSDTPAPVPVVVAVPAGSQVTLNVGSQYSKLAQGGSKNIAVQVSSDEPIAVDRVLYWGTGSGSAKYGFSLSPAIASGSQSQAFALLPTAGGSQSFLTVLNPGTSVATVSLTLLNASGSTLKTVPATVKGQARYTFDIAGLLPGDNGNISGVLTSDTPVVAEASLYFGGSPIGGSIPGTVEQGTAGTQSGARVDLSSSSGLLRIYNPGTADVRVQALQGRATGGLVVFDGTVPAGNTKDIQLPAAGSAGGAVVLASGSVAASLVNGDVGSKSISGGSLS